MKNYLIIVKHIKKFICHKASKGGKVMENFKRLLKYIKPYKFLILLALFCAFVSNIAVIVATYLNGKAIDNIVGTNNVNFKCQIIIYQI